VGLGLIAAVEREKRKCEQLLAISRMARYTFDLGWMARMAR
jgi:hypothetical protein